MTTADQRRAWVLTKFLCGELSVREVALFLGLSERSVWRLQARFAAEGPAALVHGNRGRASGRRTGEATRARGLALARTTYAGINDTHLAELLAERDGIALSRVTVRRILRADGRLEQELRALALDNAFGRVGDDDYLRRKGALTAELGEARRPAAGSGVVDPARALAWLDDLRSLWEVEVPERPEHAATRREYEVRRTEATAAAFERLEVLGPVIVEAKVAEDLLAGGR